MALQIVSSNRYVINNDDEVAPASQPKNFNDAAESYLAHGGEARYLKPILAYLGDQPLASIFPFDIREMAKVLFPGVKNATLNRQALTPVRAVINHAYERGWCNLLRLRNFKQDDPKRKVPAPAVWLQLFVRECDRSDLPHVAALVLFMAHTAARVSEAVALEWTEVDLQARTALLLRTKTGRNCTRHLTDELINRMHDLRA
jgi:integrase